MVVAECRNSPIPIGTGFFFFRILGVLMLYWPRGHHVYLFSSWGGFVLYPWVPLCFVFT